jgi:hypothetical protein
VYTGIVKERARFHTVYTVNTTRCFKGNESEIGWISCKSGREFISGKKKSIMKERDE